MDYRIKYVRVIVMGIIFFSLNSCVRAKKKREASVDLVNTAINYYRNGSPVLDKNDPQYLTVVDSAIAMLEMAIQMDSSNNAAYWNLISFSRDIEAYQKAIFFSKLYFKHFEHPWGLMTLGEIYGEMGDTIRSAKSYREAEQYYMDQIGKEKLIEDSILMDLVFVNIYLNEDEKANKYYERYRSTKEGQRIYGNVTFDSLITLLMKKN